MHVLPCTTFTLAPDADLNSCTPRAHSLVHVQVLPLLYLYAEVYARGLEHAPLISKQSMVPRFNVPRTRGMLGKRLPKCRPVLKIYAPPTKREYDKGRSNFDVEESLPLSPEFHEDVAVATSAAPPLSGESSIVRIDVIGNPRPPPPTWSPPAMSERRDAGGEEACDNGEEVQATMDSARAGSVAAMAAVATAAAAVGAAAAAVAAGTAVHTASQRDDEDDEDAWAPSLTRSAPDSLCCQCPFSPECDSFLRTVYLLSRWARVGEVLQLHKDELFPAKIKMSRKLPPPPRHAKHSQPPNIRRTHDSSSTSKDISTSTRDTVEQFVMEEVPLFGDLVCRTGAVCSSAYACAHPAYASRFSHGQVQRIEQRLENDLQLVETLSGRHVRSAWL